LRSAAPGGACCNALLRGDSFPFALQPCFRFLSNRGRSLAVLTVQARRWLFGLSRRTLRTSDALSPVQPSKSPEPTAVGHFVFHS
jgi:hypothetical protein